MAVPTTTLSGAINSSVTTATVASLRGFADEGELDDLVQIDAEYLLVTAGLGTTVWTVTRGYAGSTAAAHSDGATVTRIARGYTDLAKVKAAYKGMAGTATDDGFLRDVVASANDWLVSEIGYFFGPSTDASRTYDVGKGGNEIWIRGGLRSLTTLEVKSSTGAAFATVTTGDAVIRPIVQDRELPGLDGDRLTFTDLPTGTLYNYYSGYGVVRVTGVFGPAEPPANLSRIATTVAVWLYQSRQSGVGAVIGNIDTGELIVNRVLTPFDGRTIKRYRSATRSYASI